MKIFVIGTRGFPDIQGGVEQHCESLYPLIASEDRMITVFRRKPYINDVDRKYEFINFIDLPSTRISGFEALFHSFLSTLWCIFKRPDIVHIHNIGPSFFTPLLKIAGLKVVMTYHSPNYEHVKWSAVTRIFLKYSEFVSVRCSDKVIFVSKYQKEKLGNKKNFIHINNGVKINALIEEDDYIRSLGLVKKGYVLSVGRFVEEKGFDQLIRAYSELNRIEFNLVIAGDSDHETSYSAKLKQMARKNNVILTGFVRGEKLQQIYSHSRLFVLASHNEGLPISLLEAMSYHLPVLVSNIPANLQIGLPEERYFISGDEESLEERLRYCLNENLELVDYDMTEYNWNIIAQHTIDVYNQVLNKKR